MVAYVTKGNRLKFQSLLRDIRKPIYLHIHSTGLKFHVNYTFMCCFKIFHVVDSYFSYLKLEKIAVLLIMITIFQSISISNSWYSGIYFLYRRKYNMQWYDIYLNLRVAFDYMKPIMPSHIRH